MFVYLVSSMKTEVSNDHQMIKNRHRNPEDTTVRWTTRITNLLKVIKKEKKKKKRNLQVDVFNSVHTTSNRQQKSHVTRYRYFRIPLPVY